jgi:hypothetical protein
LFAKAPRVYPGSFSPLMSESGGGRGKKLDEFSGVMVLPLTRLGVRVGVLPASLRFAALRSRASLKRLLKWVILGGLSELSGPSLSARVASAAELESEMAMMVMNAMMVVG